MPFEIDQKLILSESLASLMESKSFVKISIQEIVDKCGVTRTTFYRYYRDKYELMLYVFINDITILYKKQQSQLTNIEDYCLFVLNYFQSRPKVYFNAFSYEGQNSFCSSFNDLLVNNLQEIYNKSSDKEINKQDLVYLVEAFANNTSHIIKSWVLDNFAEDKKYIASMMIETCPVRLASFINRYCAK